MKRRPLDVYETPRALALGACAWVAREVISTPPPRIWEPHCGTGSFVQAARLTWPRSWITGLDVRPEVESDALANGANNFAALDWLAPSGIDVLRPSLIIGNPPFAGCERHVARALDRVDRHGTVAFLLSINLLWPSRQKQALWELPGLRYVQPLNPRPDFLGRGGCDAVGVAMFVWQPRHSGPAELGKPLRWRGDIARTQTALELGGGA
jgi:hypothetical protein